VPKSSSDSLRALALTGLLALPFAAPQPLAAQNQA
jgi:hypothetical protein